MASKHGMKSQIPIKNGRKELSTDVVGGNLKNSKPLKTSDSKRITTVEKKICVKNKMSGEVKQSKGNAEKLLQVAKEKAETTKKSPLQKPTQRAVHSNIETLAKEVVNHLKAEKLHHNKPSTESVGNGGNVISKKTVGATSKRISGEKKAISPSLIVQPKNYVAHSGLMFKPIVKKSTECFKPFKFVPSPAKLRRSQSEYDPDFERPKPENIRPQRKCINIAQKDKVGQNIKPTKLSTLSKHRELSSAVEKRSPQNIPVQSYNPARMPKNVAVENKPIKTLHLKSKPLGRSNTINTLDSERPKAENIRPQQKGINVVKKEKAGQKIKLTKSPSSSQRKELSSGVENKFKKDIKAHSSNPFIPPRTPKTQPVEKKSSKPLRRSSTIHAFDTVRILKNATGVWKKDPVHSMRITEEGTFKNKTPVTPENIKLPLLDLEDVENIRITPKKEVPHGGLIFKLHAARKGMEKKFNYFSSVD